MVHVGTYTGICICARVHVYVHEQMPVHTTRGVNASHSVCICLHKEKVHDEKYHHECRSEAFVCARDRRATL